MRIQKGVEPSFTPVGRIAIGMKSGKEKSGRGGVKYRDPERLDYIRITTLDRDKSEGFSVNQNNFKLNKKIHSIIGDKPTAVDVILPFDDPEMILSTEYVFYRGRTPSCKGNGVVAEYTDRKSGEICQRECNIKTCPAYKQKNNPCRPRSRLSVFLKDDPNFGGIYTYRSSGNLACSALSTFIDESHKATGGKLAGMHVKLKLVTIQSPKYGAVRYLGMVFNGEHHKSMPEFVEAQKKIGYSVEEYEQKALESGELIDNDPDDVVIDEYNPDSNKRQNEDIKSQMEDDSPF